MFDNYSEGAWLGLLVTFVIFLIPFVFFLGAQQNTLKVVQSVNRTMEPSHVWLQLIPLFGLVWQFSVAKAIADSLRNELNARNHESKLGIWEDGITDEVNIHPTYTTGKWYCIMVCITCIPFIGFITVIFMIVLWISYWGQLNKYRQIIAM